MKEEKPQNRVRLIVNQMQTLVFIMIAAMALYTFQVPAFAAEGVDLVTAVAPAHADTTTRTLIPLGRTVGIKLFSDGVVVIGFSKIETSAGSATPAQDCGLKAGDIITHINSKEVDTIEEVQSLLQNLTGEHLTIQALRGESELTMTAKAVKCSSDGSYKLGAWIRDSMAGIGTLTFYNPANKTFGALGHGINDIDTSLLMPLESGGIIPATVTDVKKGLAGAPGQLHGTFELSRDLGSLYANTNGGVFGTVADDTFSTGEALPVATNDEIQCGRATILSNIKGNEVEQYEIEITKLLSSSDSDTRDLIIKITDSRLLESTGGIVQGMSGSPILQNGKIIGAVTHVLVDNPTSGYGIMIEDMLNYA
jgi:stage IV sporulation protein B